MFRNVEGRALASLDEVLNRHQAMEAELLEPPEVLDSIEENRGLRCFLTRTISEW